MDARWEEYAAAGDGPPAQIECTAQQGALTVDAFIGVAGSYKREDALKKYSTELWEIFSPLTYLGENQNLIVRLLHGENDLNVAMEQSISFNQVMLDAGYDSQMIEFDGVHQVPSDVTAELVQELAGLISK